jgi:hypothetical protein
MTHERVPVLFVAGPVSAAAPSQLVFEVRGLENVDANL